MPDSYPPPAAARRSNSKRLTTKEVSSASHFLPLLNTWLAGRPGAEPYCPVAQKVNQPDKKGNEQEETEVAERSIDTGRRIAAVSVSSVATCSIRRLTGQCSTGSSAHGRRSGRH